MNFNDKLGFKEYCSNSKIEILISTFFVLLIYGCRFMYYTIGIDTDLMIYNYMGTIRHYIGLGRYAVSLPKYLMGTEIMNPYFSSFLMIVTLLLALVVWGYTFYLIKPGKRKNNKTEWVFSVLFISSPIMAEQFYFTLQGVEVAIAIIMIAFSNIAILKWAFNKKLRFLFLGILCMMWSFGTYQSFFILYILGVCFNILLIYEIPDGKETKLFNSDCFYAIMKQILAFALGIIGYVILDKIINLLMGSDTKYISTMIRWNVDGISNCIQNILSFISSVFKGEGVFYNYLYGFSSIIFLFYIIYIIYKKRGNLFWGLAGIGVIVSPFLMSVMIGGQEPVRAQIYLPFASAFMIYYLLDHVKKNRKLLRIALAGVCFILAMRQGAVTGNLFYADYLRYEEDKLLAERLSAEISNLGQGEIPANPIVVVGYYTNKLNASVKRGNIIGMSQFEVNLTEDGGVTSYAVSFMRTLGYDYILPSVDETHRGLEIAAGMPCWPSEGSIKLKDGIIVVKLSENYPGGE